VGTVAPTHRCQAVDDWPARLCRGRTEAARKKANRVTWRFLSRGCVFQRLTLTAWLRVELENKAASPARRAVVPGAHRNAAPSGVPRCLNEEGKLT